jgi:hypothetical protein
VLSLFTTSVHTSLLGALLAFSTTQWYPLYAAGTAQWGLTPLEDQQLAGLIMWVPAGLAYVVAALLITGSWLGEAGRKTQRAVPLLVLLVLLVSCGGSKQEEAKKLEQKASSWHATVELTSELRQRGAVPDEYARQTLQAAEQELQKNQQKADQLSQ